MKKKIRKCLLGFIPKSLDHKIISRSLEILNQTSNEGAYLLDLSERNKLCAFQKDVFGQGKVKAFEDLQALVPDDYHFYLKTVYGADYMVIPKVEDRVDHGDIIVDLHKDYSLYQ